MMLMCGLQQSECALRRAWVFHTIHGHAAGHYSAIVTPQTRTLKNLLDSLGVWRIWTAMKMKSKSMSHYSPPDLTISEWTIATSP